MSALALNLKPAQQAMLDGQHRDGQHLHIGTDEGVLSLTAHDDAPVHRRGRLAVGRDDLLEVAGRYARVMRLHGRPPSRVSP